MVHLFSGTVCFRRSSNHAKAQNSPKMNVCRNRDHCALVSTGDDVSVPMNSVSRRRDNRTRAQLSSTSPSMSAPLERRDYAMQPKNNNKLLVHALIRMPSGQAGNLNVSKSSNTTVLQLSSWSTGWAHGSMQPHVTLTELQIFFCKESMFVQLSLVYSVHVLHYCF